MEGLQNLLLGFESALTPINLLYCFGGVFLGTLIGVLPGIGALAAIAMLLPMTFHIPATAAIIMLAGIYYGSQYGGSTASILLNLPGTPSSAVTCLDGYPMSRQGRAGIALFMTTMASLFGASFGIIVLTLFSPALSGLALAFGPAEYTGLIVLGLVAGSSLSRGAPLNGIAMALVGLALGMVGTDVQTGARRFTFDIPYLADGISLVALAMGVFGVAEVIASVNRNAGDHRTQKIGFRSMIPTRDDIRRSWGALARGTGIGAFLGALPGTGTSISAFMAYAAEKRLAKEPERFGKGAIEGVVAPEAANNAASQTSFIPTLSLGIPGDAIMALMLGALIIQGITPGPQLITEHSDLFWSLLASFWIGNILLVVLNLPLIGIWVAILRIPYGILYPAIIIFICVGTYSVNNSYFDVLMAIFFGVLGYGMSVVGFEAAPLVLGFVLGPLLEENLRRALLMSGGEMTTFVATPLSAGLFAAAFALLVWSVADAFRSPKKAPKSESI